MFTYNTNTEDYLVQVKKEMKKLNAPKNQAKEAGVLKMILYVYTSTGKLFKLDVERSSSIEQVKEMIEKELGMPVEYQRLSFNGMEIEDDNTLADYNIQEEEILHLMCILQGGGYSASVLDQFPAGVKNRIVELYGYRNEYDVIPDIVSKDLMEYYPKLQTFNLVVDIESSPSLKQVIREYTGDSVFADLNLRLNLLNEVSARKLFEMLMMSCLGAFQVDLPEEVYRFTNLNYQEFRFFRKNVGKYVIFKSFVSTSKKKNKHFGTDTVCHRLARIAILLD